MERMQVYAHDDDTVDRVRDKILTLPQHMVEELKSITLGGTKFEFFGTMADGFELMAVGASSFGRL